MNGSRARVAATRPLIRLPEVERTTILPDGRQQRCARWTVWTEHVRSADAEAYAAARRREIDAWIGAWDDERRAGMDPGVVHRRYPRLFMAGGIDVSQLLPFGSPQAVRDAVRKALDESEGKLMVGSSTELADAVPLANFLAMRDAALEYR